MSGDVEVQVVRQVDLDRILGEATKRMLTALVYKAAAHAIDRSPVDKGTLRKGINPQSAQYDGASIPTWATFGPKVQQPPYPAFLNAGEAKRKTGTTYRYHYAAGPRKGSPTMGWFTPGVIDDMQTAGDVDKVIADTTAWIAARWKAGR